MANVVLYLWGIETLQMIMMNNIFSFYVVLYLWGIETKSDVLSSVTFISCTVPMRNWNNMKFSITNFLCSTVVLYLWGIETQHWIKMIFIAANMLYCTYEELKHMQEFKFILIMLSVVLYLWGIETAKASAALASFILLYCTYEELKL